MPIQTKEAPQRLDIPHEPGQWIEFQPISWQMLQAASELASAKGADQAAKLVQAVGPEALKALQGTQASDDTEEVEQYDRGTLLRAAIVKWSYNDQVQVEDVDSLDERTAGWAYGVIVQANTWSDEEGEVSSADSTPITPTTGKAVGRRS